MCKKTEKFITKSKILHINKITNEPKYDYNLVEYVNAKTKVKIICLQDEHGLFEQTPDSHLHFHGCPECAGVKKLTTETFIRKANIVHNFGYDYSLVNYIDTITKIKIICKEHGIFEQIPNSHLSMIAGCPLCNNYREKDINDFIKNANIVHDFRYDYSITKYNKSSEKVEIICREHGIFKQTPNNHLSWNGCPDCAENTKGNTDEFIKTANEIHDFKYTYNKVIYVGVDIKVIITCKEHGDFLQTPYNHVKIQCGCPICKESKGEKKIKKFLEENNIIAFIRQYKFNDCKNINQLPFDFYLQDYNLCIEYDGELHYKPVEYFGGGKSLKNRKKLDKIKTDYCLNNNIKLIRIPYWDFKNIEEILKKELLFELILSPRLN